MKRLRFLVLVVAGTLLGAAAGTVAAEKASLDPAVAREFKEKIVPLLQDYCYDCHGDGSKKGDMSLDKFKDLASHLDNHELWLKVWRNVRTQIMPPAEEEFQIGRAHV